MEDIRFNFNISLSVLNHLGRNLYRNFSTILGEAISNSWDANARNVWIEIDRENGQFWIMDDGIGMDNDDFQHKFLTVGYSKRKGDGYTSPEPFSRPYIGSKGIGKLAMLSSAETISIISRKNTDSEYTGGTIDNSTLDEKIKDDGQQHDYPLGNFNLKDFGSLTEDHATGTILFFNNIKEDFRLTNEKLMKIIALSFRFSLLDEDFNIHLNGTQVTLEQLSELGASTQFVWNLNGWSDDEYLDNYCNPLETIEREIDINGTEGFIASVNKPGDRQIYSFGEKVGIDLFVNGRVRETDILKHIPTSQLPENYLYGQIHYNPLDDGTVDRFTSSREGILGDDELYKPFLEELRKTVLTIVDQWDALREKHNEDSDPENDSRLSKSYKKAKSHYREVAKTFVSEDDDNEETLKHLTEDGAFNSDSYVHCFIAENLLREYISQKKMMPLSCTKMREGEDCFEQKARQTESYCSFCKASARIRGFAKLKNDGGLAIQIRADEINPLLHLDYSDLALIINDRIVKRDELPYKPLRNSVMHTSLMTSEAKSRLTTIKDNIRAAIRRLD